MKQGLRVHYNPKTAILQVYFTACLYHVCTQNGVFLPFFSCFSLLHLLEPQRFLSEFLHAQKKKPKNQQTNNTKPLKLMETLVHKELCVLSKALNWKDGQDG